MGLLDITNTSSRVRAGVAAAHASTQKAHALLWRRSKDENIRTSSFTIQTIYVLREELKENTLFGKQADENVRDGWLVLARIQLARQTVERVWIAFEIRNVENSFSVWEIETSKIGVETGLGRSEVRYACRCTDAYTHVA